MGGGVGVSAHGSHRIVTEKSMMAMPETSIGFIPDVGGTYLLSRAPGETGLYLGLTGARMNAADAIFAGFADDYVPSERLARPCRLSDRWRICRRLPLPVSRRRRPTGNSKGLQDKITQAFSQPDALGCVQGTAANGGRCGDEWAEKTRNMIAKNSPFAFAATFAAIHKARKLGSLEECLSLEYNFAYRAIAGT